MPELRECLDAFVNPVFKYWRIRKADGKNVENFDALTLLQSFIECEIPIPDAIGLFDDVIETLKQPRFQISSGPDTGPFHFSPPGISGIGSLFQGTGYHRGGSCCGKSIRENRGP